VVPNERRATQRAIAERETPVASPQLKETGAGVSSPRLSDIATLIRHHGKDILNTLDSTLTRPVTTTPSTQNTPIVERARLRRLIAQRREGAFLTG